jgi:hypothetical protein
MRGRGRVLAICILVLWIYVLLDASDVVVMTLVLLAEQLGHGGGRGMTGAETRK